MILNKNNLSCFLSFALDSETSEKEKILTVFSTKIAESNIFQEFYLVTNAGNIFKLQKSIF